jgi:hypothetical protein
VIKSSIVLAVFLLPSATALAQAEPRVEGAYHDEIRKVTPVKGPGRVRGLSPVRASQALGPDVVLRLPVPPDLNGPVCVDIESRDGRYVGKGEFHVSAAGAHQVDIRLAATRLPKVTDTGSKDLAIRTMLGDCENGSGDILAARIVDDVRPAKDATTRSGSPDLHLLLNAGRTDVSLRVNGMEVTCRRLEVRAVAFTHQCTLQRLPAGAALDVGIFGWEGNTRVIEETITIWTPGDEQD